jgi:Zn-dependent peptidase ImmA (M78 family)
MTNKQKKEIRIVLRSMGIKFRIRKSLHSTFDAKNKMILISENNYTDSEVWSTVFHEIAHLFCYYKSIYKNFHQPKNWNKYRKAALKAERYCEKLGERFLKCYFPDIVYLNHYNNKEVIKWWRKYYGFNK